MNASCGCSDTGKCGCKGHGPGHRFEPGKPKPKTLTEAIAYLRERGKSDEEILTAIGKAVGFDFKKAGFTAKTKGTKRAKLMARAGAKPTLVPAPVVKGMVRGVARDLRTLATVYRENREG